jgi:hypothetical protein
VPVRRHLQKGQNLKDEALSDNVRLYSVSTVTAVTRRGDLAARKELNLTNHKMYKDLYKHQAFVLMQIRTECVKMADFLF